MKIKHSETKNECIFLGERISPWWLSFAGWSQRRYFTSLVQLLEFLFSRDCSASKLFWGWVSECRSVTLTVSWLLTVIYSRPLPRRWPPPRNSDNKIPHAGSGPTSRGFFEDKNSANVLTTAWLPNNDHNEIFYYIIEWILIWILFKSTLYWPLSQRYN